MSDVLNRREKALKRHLSTTSGDQVQRALGGLAAADAVVDYEAGFEYLMATTQGFPTRIQFADAVREALGRDT